MNEWCGCFSCRAINSRMMAWPTTIQSSLERRWVWLLHNTGVTEPPPPNFFRTNSFGPQ